ncbi:radical SAM protein [Nocardia higoensis]|uniref:radical SAM protein n=1 Tax=Nocardia higoensis TaxID=228599 RepID=UPI00031CC99A|nr:radical SAM protein [Nocardia higoensis]
MKPLSSAMAPEAAAMNDGLPIRVHRDRTLRVKVIDACGMACTFCHNEGTPVAADNIGAATASMTGRGRSGRVSIYLSSNGARFLPATVAPDREFIEALTGLHAELDLDDVHLTGGEPSLHPHLAKIIAVCTETGFRVGMTSNGENVAPIAAACARAGLDRVNFSIFGTTATELAQVQHQKFADTRRATRKIAVLRDSVRATLDHGLGASANIVVPNYAHAKRVRRLIDGALAREIIELREHEYLRLSPSPS